MKRANIIINNSLWHKALKLRISMFTHHDNYNIGKMFSIEEARDLAEQLNKACDQLENKSNPLESRN